MANLNNLPLNSYILDAAFSDYGNGLNKPILVYMVCEKLMIFGLFWINIFSTNN